MSILVIENDAKGGKPPGTTYSIGELYQRRKKVLSEHVVNSSTPSESSNSLARFGAIDTSSTKRWSG